MKQISPLSKGSGKLGATVFAVNSGVQIAREYQPKVTNPNTEAQQDTRARFKLMSQLSAIMAPVIAIKKDGLKTARNQFQSINFGIVQYENENASIDLNKVQLTKSNRSFAGFTADRSGGAHIAVELDASMAATADRVVYIAYEKQADGSLSLLDSKVCNTAGDDGKFADTLTYTEESVVLYAYAIKDTDASMTAKFGNLIAPSAEKVAKLLVSSSENMNAVNLTKTAGLTMNKGTNSADSNTVVPDEVTVTMTPNAHATLTGGGVYPGGSQVTIEATNIASGYIFAGWRINGESASLQNPYTFTANEDSVVEVLIASEGD